jgi:hypothetical protein
MNACKPQFRTNTQQQPNGGARKGESEMKWECLGVAALCVVNFSMAAAQDVPDIAIFSFEDISCAAWTRSRDNETVRTIYGTWFRGFVSGYNFGNSANQVLLGKMPDPPELFAYVDKYCQNNPLLAFVAAAGPLVQEIREHRVPIAPSRQ